MIKERLAALRNMMKREGWDAVVVPGSDPHSSEDVPSRWMLRQYMSGFTGSYGDIVVTQDHAGLWTDTRFFIQFVKELAGTEYVLHKLRVPEAEPYPDWMVRTLPKGCRVGIDGTCMSVAEVELLKEKLSSINGTVVNKPDYINELWPDRPETPNDPIFVLRETYTGRSTADKLSWLRNELSSRSCNSMMLSSLDEIAWLLNIRSNDILFTPVTISYLLVEADKATLYTNLAKVVPEVEKFFRENGIVAKPYEEAIDAFDSLSSDARLLMDGRTMNFAMFSKGAEVLNDRLVDGTSPVILEKALKNDVEIAGFRKAYLKDGIAQTKFFKWLEETLASGLCPTEMEAADKMASLRREQGNYLEESFAPITAIGENAALPHYQPTHEVCSRIVPKGLYLLDSGGQYLEGTTDITRTVPVGPLTELERIDYTLVLKGTIGLSTAIFPKGTRGANIDILARIPLWKAYRNFGHGTGHGVGHVLCCHEGPQDLRQNVYDQAMLARMITSVEPGLYREGMHGVRHENMILCVEKGENEFGNWLGFETLTCTYIDPSPCVPELMTDVEKAWLNNYNRSVYTRLLPWLSEEEKDWLRSKTIDNELPVPAPTDDKWNDWD